jgi:hypothetical protein
LRVVSDILEDVGGVVLGLCTPRLLAVGTPDIDAVSVVGAGDPFGRATIMGVDPLPCEEIRAGGDSLVVPALPASKIDGGSADGADCDSELERRQHLEVG